MSPLLLVSVFVIATCGLVYELIAGTLASYLLGDSVLQFSTVIGAYLFAMGVGSWLSRYVQRGVLARFVQVEILVGLIGGLSAPIMFIVFGYGAAFRPTMYLLVGLVGIMVGLEIPLVLRLLKDTQAFKDLISQVLALDYVGALVASVLFPLLLVPHLGLVRSSFLFGAMNVAVAFIFARVFGEGAPVQRALMVQAGVVLALLIAGFFASDRLTAFAEQGLFPDDVIFARSSPYQRIVVTRRRNDIRLYLNSHLQFSSADEYRYHEALVHPGLAALAHPAEVLVLGGGDGLAVRELLRDPRVAHVTLVDLDPEMTHLFATHTGLWPLNGGSLRDPRVHVINADAFVWLQEHPEARFDYVVIDFPDPDNYSIGKLYTTAFYRTVANHVTADGAGVVQSTSPMYARRSYWCIVNTIKSVGVTVQPYHVFVPSFGEWGYTLFSKQPLPLRLQFPTGLRFLTADAASDMFHFPIDMQPLETEINRLDNQILIRYYHDDWDAVPH